MFDQKLLRAFAPIALAGVLAISVGGVAQAATGQVGRHGAPAAICEQYNSRIIVSAPFMEAAPIANTSGTFIVGGGSIETGNHRQWVGFRTWLQRWNGSAWVYTDQNRDGYYDLTPLQKTEVVGQTNLAQTWLNTATNRLGGGSSVLPIREKGFYRLLSEEYWYADQYTGPGYDVVLSIEHRTQVYFDIQGPWCQF